MSSDLTRQLARLQSLRKPPPRRAEDRLPFLSNAEALPARVLFDTTVYVDTLQGKLPEMVERQIASQNPWHSAVVESELVYLCGRLDPRHPETGNAVQRLLDVVERWQSDRVLNPGRSIWREAAMVTGAISGLHGVTAEDRGRLMNDALIYLSAAEHQCAVLTRNVRDFDLLMQVAPGGRALFYRVN